MKKHIKVFFAFLFLVSVHVHGKNIAVGFHGGIVKYVLEGVPIKLYSIPRNPLNHDYDADYDVSVDLPYILNYISGIDGSIIFLDKKVSIERAQIYDQQTTNNIGDAIAYIHNLYLNGDKVFLIGHSAGAGEALEVARGLVQYDIPVSGLALIDKVSTFSNYIPGNVAEAFVYYQRDDYDFSKATTPNLHGEDNFILMDQSYTKLNKTLIKNVIFQINNTPHASLDNDPRVWKDIADSFFKIISAEDNDKDGIADSKDNCPDNPNIEQQDSNNDGYGDVCEQTNSAGTGVNVGDPEGDGDNLWEGYKRPIGLKYVELCEDESDGCESSLAVALDELPRWDIRAKLKRKGGQWKDVDVDYYCSNDRDFGDSDDVYLGRKSKELTKEEYDGKSEKSVYLKNVDLTQCITEIDKYYLFVVVNYSGGKNPSTENDGEEHVRIEVGRPLYRTPKQLSVEEIMQVVLPVIQN